MMAVLILILTSGHLNSVIVVCATPLYFHLASLYLMHMPLFDIYTLSCTQSLYGYHMYVDCVLCASQVEH